MMCMLEKADAGWTIDDLNDYLNGKIGARVALLPSDIKHFLIEGFSELIRSPKKNDVQHDEQKPLEDLFNDPRSINSNVVHRRLRHLTDQPQRGQPSQADQPPYEILQPNSTSNKFSESDNVSVAQTP